LKDFDTQIPADLKDEINGKVAAVRSALQGEDTDRIESTTNDLMTAVQRVGSAIYGQQGQGQQPPTGDAGGQPGGDGHQGGGNEGGTVEGEYREM